jgi:NAD(P)-dependent dehydrogenase (short-subunit alcohol dehydrogenase family)
MDELSYVGRVVVITGAGRGLGREYALAFAARGAAVVVNDIGTTLDGSGLSTCEPADEVVAQIKQSGGRAVAHHESVATAQGAQGLIETAIDAFGQVDTVINNAGVLNMKPFDQMTLEGLERHLAVHVKGSFLVCKAAWPHMVKRRYGRIVNTISGGIFGLPGLTEYGPAKGGVFAFSRSLALEAIEHGIRVNALAPQGSTRMLHASALDSALRESLDKLMKPHLVTPGPLYLGHESCSINGETLAISGGKVCRIALTYNDGFTDPALTPEMIRDRLKEVLDASTARVWTSATSRYEARAVNG